MAIKVIGSHMCPDTLYALHKLAEAGAAIDFVDMFSSHDALKQYLALRDNDPLYADVRGTGSFGIPCFIREDGSKTRNLEEVLK